MSEPATFDDAERAFRAGKALTGDEWATLGPDFWPSGHEWHNYNPKCNVPRNRMGGGATSREWPKVVAAQNRCTAALKPVTDNPEFSGAERRELVAFVIAEWQADERRRENKPGKPRRKVNVHVPPPRKPDAPPSKIERERADDAAWIAQHVSVVAVDCEPNGQTDTRAPKAERDREVAEIFARNGVGTAKPVTGEQWAMRRREQANRGDLSHSDTPDYFRMLKPDLKALGTPEALSELARRKAKRQAKQIAA